MALRRTALLFTLFCAFGLGIEACKKDDASAPSNNGGGSNNGGTDNGGTDTTVADTVVTIKCTINGVAFVSDTVIITQVGEVRYFTGIRGNRRIIIATSDSLPGTYALGSDNPSVSYQSGNTVFGPAFSNTGTLNITVKDTIGMDGNFTANVQDILVTGQTIQLPDGQFFNLPVH